MIIIFMLPLYFWFVKVEKMKLFYVFMCSIAVFSFSGLINAMVERRIWIESYLSTYGLMAQWAVIIFVFIIYIFGFHSKIKWIIHHFHIKKVWYVVWVVPMMISLSNIFMVPQSYQTMQINRVWRMSWIYNVVFLFIFFLFQYMFYLIAKTTTEKLETEKKNQMLEMQSRQYADLQLYLQQTRQLRHDFKHTIHTITILAKEKQEDELIQYLENYNNELSSVYSHYFFCENSAVNAILNYYAQIAKQHQIELDWKISLASQIHISDVDLCSIIGNLLENAVHGCMTISIKRYIHLSIDIDESNELYIIISNNFDGQVKQKDNRYLSLKKDGNGIGLLSIEATVDKYHGYTHFTHSQKEFIANVMIPLYE